MLKKSPTFEHAQKSTELRLRYNHAGMFSYKFLNGVDVLSIVFELWNILGGDIKKKQSVYHLIKMFNVFIVIKNLVNCTRYNIISLFKC